MKTIIDFLIANGYQEDTEPNSGYRTFYKDGVSIIDINEKEIVLVGSAGDWLHLPMNYYALLGALISNRELACNYIE